jgi:hypothetical protein
MVVSHYYKYIFIETPQTGCTAIRKELLENYKGEVILNKHSVYSEFLAIANKAEKEYFVFSSIRNPLDKFVSSYIKIKDNHKNRYTDRLSFKGKRAFFDFRDKIKYRKVKNQNLSYYDFLKMSTKPYDDISTLDHKKFNFIIKYENLNDDFKKSLVAIGIKPLRDLPVYNNTKNKKHYLEYYIDDKTKLSAFAKFIYFMNYWDYKFPQDWNVSKITVKHKIIWNVSHIFRTISWKYLRKGLKDV